MAHPQVEKESPPSIDDTHSTLSSHSHASSHSHSEKHHQHDLNLDTTNPNALAATLTPTGAMTTTDALTTEGKEGTAMNRMSTRGTQPELEYIQGLKLFLVIAALILVCFLMLLDSSIVTTAIPVITNKFNSVDDIGWYGSAYLIASCSLQPLAGKFYAQFSNKYTFMTFVALFELGSVLCGAATSSNMFIIGRAVAGMGCAGILNGSITIITSSVPLEKRGLYIGIMMGFVQLGILIGPLLGGVLTQYASWRWCFYINLPAGGVALAFLSILSIPERRIIDIQKPTWRQLFVKLDMTGFLLFAPSAIMFLLALEWGGTTYPWSSATVIGLFCGAAGNFAVFLLWEYTRGDSAMIPLGLVRRRVVYSACLFQFFNFGNLMTVTYYLPEYFQDVKGKSPTTSGVWMLPSVITGIFVAVGSGVAVGKIGYYIPFAVLTGVFTSICSGLLSTLKPDSSAGQWIGFQIIGGLGRMGMQMPILAVQNNLEPKLSQVAIAILVFSQTMGGALLLAFDQTALNTGLSSALKQYAPNVSLETVLRAGTSGFRTVLPAEDVPGVVLAYNQAIQHVWFLATGVACGCFLASWGMGFKSIKKVKKGRRDVEEKAAEGKGAEVSSPAASIEGEKKVSDVKA